MANITEHTNQLTPSQNGVEMQKLLQSVLTDLAALTAAVNQLITDYNANANIVDNTTATPVTLVTKA